MNYLFKKLYVILKAMRCIYYSVRCGKRFKGAKTENGNVLVVGNGPSLNRIDLKECKGIMDICCVNYFANKNKELFFELKPKYYCMIEDSEFTQNLKDVCPETRELINTLKLVNWPMTFITKQGYHFPIKNKFISWTYASNRDFSLELNRKIAFFLYKRNFASDFYGGVVICAGAYFVTKRFNGIYFVGIDENALFQLHVDRNNHVFWGIEHFYEYREVDMVKNGDIEKGRLYEFVELFVTRLRQFRSLNEYAEHMGVKIINCNPDSYIDTIKKTDWNSVISELRARR